MLINSLSESIYFKVIDETGNPNTGATVNFNLTDPTGSKIIDGLSSMAAYTENNGLVSTSLNSMKTIGNYTIVATLETDDSQSANANIIVVANPNELNLPSLGLGMAINSAWAEVDTNTIFAGGMKVNNDEFYADVVLTPNDTVLIQGAINVDRNHVGMPADIIVVASYKPVASFGAVEEEFVIVDSNNALQIWDQDLASLVEFARIDNLPTQQPVNMYGGTLPLGKVQVYFAYRLDDGLVVFNGYQTINAQIRPATPPDFSSIPEQDSTLEFSGEINIPIIQKIAITNNGDNPLIITSSKLNDQLSSNFAILDDFPINLGANESKIVTVQCTPSEEGLHEANIEFITNDQNAQLVNYSLECTGEEVIIFPPEYLSNPVQNTTLEFSSEVGTPSTTATISITNGGDETLIVDSSQLVGENSDDFTVTGDFPINILDANDSSKMVTVQCTPSEEGKRKANLEFVTNAQLVSYSLECNGIKEIIIPPPEAKYSSIPKQNSTLKFSSEINIPITKTITITNNGDATLVIEYPKLVGENPDDFTVTGDFPINILDANDSSKMVTVQCTPSEEGNRKANLEFVTNDQNALLVSYPLECTGIEKIVTPPLDDTEIIVLPTKTFEESKLTQSDKMGVTTFLTAERGYAIAQPNLLSPDASSEEAARSFLSVYGSKFGINDQAKELDVTETQTASQGREFVHFQHSYEKIPVIGGEMIVQMDGAKNILSINGGLIKDIDVNIASTISDDIARETALAEIAKIYERNVDDLTATEPELSIFNPFLMGFSELENMLVWRMEVSSTVSFINEFVLVNAHSGEIALHFSQIHTALNNTTLDAISVQNLSFREATECHPDDSACNNAHNFAADTYDFFLKYHGRDSIDGKGMEILSYVNVPLRFFPGGTCNASWSPNDHRIAYGIGCGFEVDDIVAHELTHGITEYESDLFYMNESGAINESFSDIWGEFVDLNNGKGTDTLDVKWINGEDAPDGYQRSLKDPTRSDYPQPDRITNNFYCADFDNGGVHINSGVGNKAAYLMTEGDTFNGYTVKGLGISKVANLYYAVNSKKYLNTTANYQALYNALTQACNNLNYSIDDCQQVQNALLAVEMNIPACRPDLPTPIPPPPVGDFCQINGLYGDGVCDSNCPQPDPDCTQSPTPSCQSDNICVSNCLQPDPDCPVLDFCEIEGYYGDDLCDTDCPNIDPDCSRCKSDNFCVKNCQQPDPDCRITPPHVEDVCISINHNDYNDGWCDFDCLNHDPDCDDDIETQSCDGDFNFLCDLDEEITDFVDDILGGILDGMFFTSVPSVVSSTQQFFMEHEFTNVSRFKASNSFVTMGKTKSQGILEHILEIPRLDGKTIITTKEISLNDLKFQRIFFEGSSISDCYWLQNKSEIITNPTITNDESVQYDFVYIGDCNSNDLIENIFKSLE